MKIQQQRILISNRSTTELKDRRGGNELHLVDKNEKVINSEFFICGENDHIKLKVQEEYNWFSIFHVKNLQK